MYIQVHVHTHTHTHTHTTHTHRHTHTHTHTHRDTHTQGHTHTEAHTCTQYICSYQRCHQRSSSDQYPIPQQTPQDPVHFPTTDTQHQRLTAGYTVSSDHSYLDGLIEQVHGTHHNSTNHFDRITQHIQTKHYLVHLSNTLCNNRTTTSLLSAWGSSWPHNV